MIVDPRIFPVLGVDSHLPAVPAVRLTGEALRERFTRIAGWLPELAGDGNASDGRFGERASADAAVLVGLVQRDAGLQGLLTHRATALRDHAGQISFPGGRSEASDHGPADTARREAREEIGLASEHVEVIGLLPAYTTVTRFVVTPVVALVQPPFTLQLDPSEVSEAFEVPLAWLMNPANHQRHALTVQGVQRQFLSMPWTEARADGSTREHTTWGATAAMLRNLYRLLSD
ncbi:MAG: CoA pyrophosphatase [Rubrivivax sp.]